MKTRMILVAALALVAFGCSDDDKPRASAAIEGSNVVMGAIPDNNPMAPLTSEINIEDEGVITHPERVSITVELSHTFSGDLTVELIAPNGQSMPLIKRLGVSNTTGYGLGANFGEGEQLIFNIENETPLPTAALLTDAIIQGGDYKPTGEDSGAPLAMLMIDMNDFLNGKEINGNWKLRVADYSSSDVGQLVSWKINFAEGALN